MSDIIKLSAEVIDQIAAGEVVERPSHLIKELLENSIDAHSTEIFLEVNDGGKNISLSDNGMGIKKEQLKLALSRHATSKIKNYSDLWHLHSFGFRGEALASIAAVSKLRLTSQFKDSNQAFQLWVNFGVVEEEPIKSAQRVGTQVSVENLFANVPARLKFLKSDAAEMTQIKNTIKAIALSNPRLAIKLKTKGKLVYNFPSESEKSRIETVLESESLFPIDFEYNKVKVKGFISSPSQVARSSKNIWTFVQNRWVNDKTINAAIIDAYRTLLMHGEYPYVVLWVDVPSDEVDVNIHPTKSEVKFVNSSDVYRSVNKAVRLELEKSPWLGHEGVKVVKHNQLMKSNSKLKPQENLNFQNSEFDKTQYQQKTPLMVSKTNLQSYSLKSPVSSYKGESNSDARDENKYQMNELDAFLNTEKVTKSSPNKKLLNNDKDWKASFINESNSIEFVKNNTFQQTETLENTHNVKESFSCEIKNYWKNMQVLTQLNQTYIVCQNSDKFILIDQHAAHERVMFEKLNKSWELKKFECQNYLIPLTFETSEEEALVINENKDMLLKMGFGVDLLSEKEVAINWAPSFINEKTVKIIIFQLAKEIMQASGSFAIENNINHIFATMACHSAIRAGQALSLEEMQSLLKQMDEFSFSSYCPHGRPVSIDFTWYEIEKLFGRIV